MHCRQLPVTFVLAVLLLGHSSALGQKKSTPIGTHLYAWERITAGASLVQLYSAMVYEGPGIARRIADGLRALLGVSQMANISEAVGSDAD